MRRALRVVALLLALALVAGAVFATPTIWGRPWSIEHFYTRVFAEFVLSRPQLLSQLRILEPWGIRWYNDDLDDLSVAFSLAEAERLRDQLRTLREYPLEEQTPAQRFSTRVLDWFLAVQVDGEAFRFHDFPLNPFSGVQTELPDFLLNVHQIHDARDARDYVTRLSKVGTAIDQVIEASRFRAARGIVPPKVILEGVAANVETFLAGGAHANPLAVEFARRLDTVDGLSDAERAELLADARSEVAQTVLPAWERLADFLPELMTQAPEAEAEAEARSDTVANDEPHLEPDAQAVSVPDLGDVLRALHRDERFLYPDDDARTRILADYQAIVDEATSRLPALFGRLPQAPVRVERVPAFKEAGAAGAYYLPPPLDGSKPGIFYANLRDPRDVVTFGMRTLAYHEAIPGHHLQIALAMEMEGVPIFRRVVPFTAFIEGWALYAERLAAEQGWHPTPMDRLGQLVAEGFRAARLVVDTGLHAKRWTREQAIDYMLQNTGMPETDVVAEWLAGR